MKKLALIGNSTVTRAFVKKYNDQFDISTFTRPDYDIANKSSCDKLIAELQKFNIIILTPGIMSEDLWETYLTNTLGPSYITHALYQHSVVDHVIVIGSHAGTWSSWPDIEYKRLFYNCSKQAISNFVMAMSHSGQSKTKLTAFDPAAFLSNMNPDINSMKIDHVVETLFYICNAPKSLDIVNIKIRKPK